MLTVQNSLELPKPSHWPVSMAAFGKNPQGEPLYRVVFAPTVFKLIFGTAPDGTVGAHKRPTYRHIGKKWIIEKWLSGWETTKMSPKEYETYGPRDPQSGMLLEGPYPSNGIYHHCWTFEGENPEIGSIEKIINLIKKGEGKSIGQIKDENKALDEKEEKRADAERFMRVRETEPLYGIRPASFAGSPKAVNHKTQREPISAQQTGLPYKRGSVVAMRGPTVNASI
jgi:hypothetical protein